MTSFEWLLAAAAVIIGGVVVIAFCLLFLLTATLHGVEGAEWAARKAEREDGATAYRAIQRTRTTRSSSRAGTGRP